jgi:heat shock protein HslJ
LTQFSHWQLTTILEEKVSSEESSKSNNTLVIILVVALGAALLCVLALGGVLIFRDSGSDTGEGALPPAGMTVEATVEPPTPQPGEPTATVIARAGVNVRVGPDTVYPVIGIAPFMSTLEVVGVSEDGTWWAVRLPGAPNGRGWVADEFVEVENAGNVPVVLPPPTPTPATTLTPTATPAPEIVFTASRTVINAGESSNLTWNVENVRAVYMYPVGGRFENYPVSGQGSQEVRPYITTSYELLVFNLDGSTSSSRIEITVTNGLTSSRWLLQSYSTPSGGLQTPISGKELTARFDANGSLTGSAGCNTYSGGFTAYDQTLRIGTLSSSSAFCESPEGAMEQEGTFLNLMHQAATMEISAGQLSIFDSNSNRILVFLQG